MSDLAHILVVDDELSMRELLDVMLSREGFDLSFAEDGRSAIKLLENERFDLLLCDIRLGDISGIEVLKFAKNKHPDTVVIMISAYATTEAAVEAMNRGAYDYVPKPFDSIELKHTITRALELKTIEREKKTLDDEVKRNLHFNTIIGSSPGMEAIYEFIRQVAPTRTTVMITGESGTGKEIIARAIHAQSPRCEKPFVAINCGGIPEALMESELFGHKRGAFTGASSEKEGLFESARSGTVFLDEISDLSLPLQVKLLRALQEKVIRPVGSNTDINIDVRFISATNRSLEKEVIAGRFREDLFYRLNVIELKVPPLRERKSDLKALAQHFLEKYSKEMGKQISKISSYAINLLQKYDFPGNVRELENLMERSVALSTTNIILPDSLALSLHKRRWIEGVGNTRFDLDAVAKGVELDKILDRIEAAYLGKALEVSKGNRQEAADLLGISLRSLRYRFAKHDLA